MSQEPIQATFASRRGVVDTDRQALQGVGIDGDTDRPLSLPRLEILNPDREIQKILHTETVVESWFDDRGELCMWSTVRRNRPCVVSPGLALYELHEDTVLATPFRSGVDRVVEEAYWRSVLPLFLQHQGVQALHASAVMGPDGVVGICGRAGAGKSTLAYGLNARGHRLWADDALVISALDPPRTMAMKGELRLLADVQKLMGLSAGRLRLETEAGEEARLTRMIVLRADAQVQSNTPSARRMEAGEAFAAIVENAYVYGFEGSKRAMSEAFLALADVIPVHEIVRPQSLNRFEETIDLVDELITG